MTTSTESLKWMRSLQLLVGKDGTGDVSPATGLLIEGLRITFEFTKTIYRTPNVATIKVYNLNSTSEGKILKEFNDVILQGGYGAIPSSAPAAKELPKDYGRGNIDLNHRPRIQNSDGSISTVYSMTFGPEDDGMWVLVPGVRFGLSRRMTSAEAYAWYQSSGEYLGKFTSQADADAYARSLHEDQATLYARPSFPKATPGLFFRGNVSFGSAYRDETSRICEINAKDGDKDFRGALVNFTLAAGHTDADAVRKVLESFRATTLGHVHGKNLHVKHGRGRTFSGNARDVLDRIAGNNDAEWSIQNGLLTMVPVDSTLPTEAFEVSSETGLLGTPEANDQGITMKVLLDPRIIPGSKVWLKNNEVKTKHLKAAVTGQKRKLHGPNVPARMDPDGIYKVYAVHGVGDTRGDDWFSELKCVALDAPIPSRKGMPQSSAPDGEIL